MNLTDWAGSHQMLTARMTRGQLEPPVRHESKIFNFPSKQESREREKVSNKINPKKREREISEIRRRRNNLGKKMEELSLEDSSALIEAASDFAQYPGQQNDAAVREFLRRFPLPLIINALQMKGHVAGLESALVGCLGRVFKTKHGASLIPHYMPFLQVGLKAESQEVRCLACDTVSSLLDNLDDQTMSAARLIADHGIYPLLLDCLVNGNEQVANASMMAIRKLACSPHGMEIVFTANTQETCLGNLVSQSSSLGRVRVLSLIVKLFAVSPSVASAVYNSNLINLLEAELYNMSDPLVTLSILELFYELAQVEHGTEFLSRTSLVQLLSSIISNQSVDAILRSRVLMIGGRLLSNENVYTFLDESSVRSIILAIDGILGLRNQDPNERESAIEALGLIGSTSQGGNLLLHTSPSAIRHVIDSAFDRQGRSTQLVALHALGNIFGETRPDNNVLLTVEAEEILKRLMYEAAAKTSKLTPSGLFLSALQQDSEARLAVYRIITGLVFRPWCLMEICSKQDIINMVTDPNTETTKIGMEARYSCCKAIYMSFNSSTMSNNPAFTGLASRLQEAVSRGPYIAGKPREAQPIVQTAQRF